MILEYGSGRLIGDTVSEEFILENVIPERSQIRSIIIQSYNDHSGSVTLQTKAGADIPTSERVLFYEDIDAAGFYTGNSAKDFFLTRQNLNVKVLGNLEVKIWILYWVVDDE